MNSPLIQSALADMQALAAESRGAARGSRVDTAVGAGGFVEELQSSLARINDLQQQAAGKVEAFESGADLTLNEVMVDVQKAGLAFQMGVQVRNRLLNAYREIMNMQV